LTADAPDRSAPPRIGGHDLGRLARERFDLIVVGGGITGAGVARHAAQCGLRTLLLEAADFAAGTSSRSTKLIHGGLRYLAMGDIALVREGALERKSLLAMAPHLTEPRWMLVPAASRLGYWKLRIGIGLYERLGAVAAAERHRNLQGAGLAAVEPHLDTVRLPWACLYREYHTDDARLVLATLRAAAAEGAIVCNHAPVESIERDSEGCRLTVRDARDGARHAFAAPAVVNAAGPWVDVLLAQTDGGARGSGSFGKSLYLSKGVHVVVAHARLPVRNMVMMTAADGRPVFAIARDGVTYVGTTDTPHTGGPELWPAVEAQDVDYLLATANSHFPMSRLERTDVLATWAGLRPLIHQAGKAPREMSRRDEIWRDGPLVTVAGGKLTGFRRMAEQTMAAVGEVLGRRLDMPAPLAPLPGGDRGDLDGLQREVATRYQLDDPVAERLVRLYGSETFAVLGERPEPMSASVFREEVRWAMEVEGARTLEDVLYRRLRVAWYQPDERAELVERVAEVMAGLQGWEPARRAAEVAAAREQLAQELVFA
jgi:glycerol-3-phosphate dehydrogenase